MTDHNPNDTAGLSSASSGAALSVTGELKNFPTEDVLCPAEDSARSEKTC